MTADRSLVPLMPTETIIGSLAAVLTMISFVPRLKEYWTTGSATGLSLRMLAILAAGVALWLIYGMMRGDAAVVAASTAGLALLLTILVPTLRSGNGLHTGPYARQPDNEALRLSEERYRTVVESARDYAIFTTDREGRVVDWYDGAAAVFGWTHDEIRGRSADVLYTPLDRAKGEPVRELATAASEGVAPDVRWHLRKDGSKVFIEGKVVRVGDGSGLARGFLKIGQDVTARRRAERELRLSEERFSRFAEASSDVLWIREASSLRFEYVSTAFEEIYGVERRHMMGAGGFRRWLGLVHPADRKSVLRAIRRVRSGERLTHEFRICRPDGELRWIRDTDFALLTEAGRIHSVAGIGADSTEQVIAAQRRQVLVSELQHRTRNLIAVIQALAAATEREAGSVADFQHRFRNRMSALARVQGMLSRLDDGQRVTFDSLLESELTAHGMAQERVMLSGPRGVTLKSRTLQTLALALHELATNAIKHGAFTSDVGRLAVHWELEPDGTRLRVDWRETGVVTSRQTERGSGYGRELIERALPYQMGARTTYAIEPDGVHCTIALSL